MSKNSEYNILIPDLIPPPGDVEQKIFGPKSVITTAQAMSNNDVAEEMWSACQAVLAYDKCQYNKEVISKLRNCKVIVRAGIGVDNIDTEEAKSKGIAVCNVPDYCMSEVADHTMAFLLSLVRGFPEHAKQIPQGTWSRSSDMSFRLDGKIFGILGWGRIGQAAAKRASAFGLKVIFFDPFVKDNKSGIDAEQVKSLGELAKQSDIISVHTPLTPETKGMLNDSFFAKVKKGVFLLNSARVPVIDLTALEKAMKDDVVKGCGIDALPTEFPEGERQLFEDYEKQAEWLKGRLIITPHTAYYSREAMVELRSKSALEAKRVLDGEKPLNCVNNFYG